MVSLLLLTGAALIICEGPVGPSYVRALLGPKADTKEVASKTTDSPAVVAPDAAKPAATTKIDAKKSTWVTAADAESPLHDTVLGELPADQKSDSASK